MRLPRFRFTVLRMMIGVAAVAVLLESGIVWNRYNLCRNRVAFTQRHAKGLRRVLAKYAPPGSAQSTRIKGLVIDFEDGSPVAHATQESTLRMITILERRSKEFEQAARRPWLPLPAGLK